MNRIEPSRMQVSQAESAGPPASQSKAPHLQPPPIPDHEVLRRIGGGSYGEVWLARNILGELRAVKMVYRSSFEDDRPFEREFEGIQKFEPISRSHPSQLAILHVGRDEANSHFFYVMELADDATTERSSGALEPGSEAQIDRCASTALLQHSISTPLEHSSTPALRNPASYSPKTLRTELKQHGRLRPDECVHLGIALTKALEHLHGHGLVHRDIKPSNIIFVGGEPKLADIGLVTEAGDGKSIVGTEGYLAPEGPGSASADLYSLGKVIYEISTGGDRRHFPDLPPDLEDWPGPDRRALLELNEVLLKACAHDSRQRYQTAAAIRADLETLQRGGSVRRKHTVEQRLGVVRKVGVAIFVLAALLGGLLMLNPFRPQKITNPEVARLYSLARSHLDKATKAGKLQALESINRALQLDPRFVPGYATLLGVYFWDGLVPDQDQKIRNCADKLMEIDPTLPETHTAVSYVKSLDWDWQGAEQEIQQAIEREPNYAQARHLYGFYLAMLGRIQESQVQYARAQQLNPTSRDLATDAAQPFQVARQYPQAIAQVRKALNLDENYEEAHETLADIYEDWGRYPEAIAEFEKSEILSDRKPAEMVETYRALRQAYEEGGARGYWLRKRDLMESLGEFRDLKDLSGGPWYYRAKICANLGEREQALDFLEKAWSERPDITWLKLEPCWDSLCNDPRFRALLKQARLER